MWPVPACPQPLCFASISGLPTSGYGLIIWWHGLTGLKARLIIGPGGPMAPASHGVTSAWRRSTSTSLPAAGRIAEMRLVEYGGTRQGTNVSVRATHAPKAIQSANVRSMFEKFAETGLLVPVGIRRRCQCSPGPELIWDVLGSLVDFGGWAIWTSGTGWSNPAWEMIRARWSEV